MPGALNDEDGPAAAPDVDALVAKMSAHRIIKTLPLRTGSETSSLAPRSSSSCPSHYSPRSSSPSPPPHDSWSSSLTSPDASTGPQSAMRPLKLDGGGDAHQQRQHTNLVAAAAALVLPYWPRNREAQELALFRMSGVGPKAILDHLEREARARGGPHDDGLQRPSSHHHHHHHRNSSTGGVASATTTSRARAVSPPSSDHWHASSSTSKKRKNSLDGEATRVRDRDFQVFSDAGSDAGAGSIDGGGDDATVERPDVSSRTFRASRLVDEIASGHVDCGCTGGVDASFDKPPSLWPSRQQRRCSSETPWSTRWRSVLAKNVRSRLVCQRAAGPPAPTPPPPLGTQAGQAGTLPTASGTTTTAAKAKVSRAERRAMALKGKGGQKMTLAQLKAQRSGGTTATAASAPTTPAAAAVKSAPAPAAAAAAAHPPPPKATPPTTQFTFSVATPLTSVLSEARQRLANLLTQPVADVVTALDLPRPVFDEEDDDEGPEGEDDDEGSGEEDSNYRRSDRRPSRSGAATGSGPGSKSSPLREAYFSIPSARVPMLYPWADTQRTPRWQPKPRGKEAGNTASKSSSSVSDSWPELAQGWPLAWRDGWSSWDIPPPGSSAQAFSMLQTKSPTSMPPSAPGAAAVAPAAATRSPPTPAKMTRRQKARINNVHHAVNSHRWMPSGVTGGGPRDAAPHHDDGAYTHQASLSPEYHHDGGSYYPGTIPGLALDDFCVYCDYVHLYGEAPRFWPGGPCRHRCPEKVGPAISGVRRKKGKGKGTARRRKEQVAGAEGGSEEQQK